MEETVVSEPFESMTESVSRYGITWHFDEPVPAGQFITGDWWVVGPVTVTGVEPAPGPVTDEMEKVVKSIYGAQATQGDNRMRNGSMIPLKASGRQGYDSRLKNYMPELGVSFPVNLAPGTSQIGRAHV